MKLTTVCLCEDCFLQPGGCIRGHLLGRFEKLLKENARLRALLELHGIDVKEAQREENSDGRSH